MQNICPHRFLLVLTCLWAVSASLSGQPDRVFYAGDDGSIRFFGLLELADGTLLVGGSAGDLDWLPEGVPVTQLSAVAENGSSLLTEGVHSELTAFILRLDANASEVLEAVHLPHGAAFNIAHIKTDTPPSDTTGNLYVSGQRGGTGGFINGYQRLYWLPGSANALPFSPPPTSANIRRLPPSAT